MHEVFCRPAYFIRLSINSTKSVGISFIIEPLNSSSLLSKFDQFLLCICFVMNYAPLGLILFLCLNQTSLFIPNVCDAWCICSPIRSGWLRPNQSRRNWIHIKHAFCTPNLADPEDASTDCRVTQDAQVSIVLEWRGKRNMLIDLTVILPLRVWLFHEIPIAEYQKNYVRVKNRCSVFNEKLNLRRWTIPSELTLFLLRVLHDRGNSLRTDCLRLP